MALIVTVFVPDGIVISCDSRAMIETQNNDQDKKKYIKQYTDNCRNLFVINNRFGLGAYGQYYINEKPLSFHINNFVNINIKEDSEIDLLPQLLLKYFNENLGSPNTVFYLAGYKKDDKNNYIPHVYIADIKQNIYQRINLISNQIAYNYHFGGESDIILRLFNEGKIKDGDNYIDLQEEKPNFMYYSLEDAFKFSRYLIKVTKKINTYIDKTSSVGGKIHSLTVKENCAKTLK